MSFALVLKKTSWYRGRYSRPLRVKCCEKEWQHYKVVNALLSQLFLECVAGLNDRKGCIFTNDMKLTRQNMKYFVFILSAMKYKSK